MWERAEFLRIGPADPSVVILNVFHVLGKDNADQFINQDIRLLIQESGQVFGFPPRSDPYG